MLLSQHPPDAFRTRNIQVELEGSAVHLSACGPPFDFTDLLQQRSNPPPQEGSAFTATHLGVSGFIRLRWQELRFLLLVRQQRADRGDRVLKLPSGYVDLDLLATPALALEQEISQELLLHSEQELWPIERNGSELQRVYQAQLSYHPECAQLATATPFRSREVYWEGEPLTECECYLHRPTGSVQLVYHWDLELPDRPMSDLSLWQLEERINPRSGLLETLWEEREPLWLAALNDYNLIDGGFYQLRDGLLLPAEGSAELQLSEYFAPRQGLWVNAGNQPLREYHPYC
ncbi:hypothetical protein [Aestuariirhabdus litorea]|uniref:Uncharacterized protein n=1 Tax=Aestuariirhabdus litorea TaxID=2528527 RepID=A0A3P3VND3_9GAMM|nr:hypothetical protein [Aestuariirhabdus litorea]RRJ82343.1 hypothetical protein D0544_10685 [Aestuariirhabdus litorea]RWW92508.1 hypothetical protein DZC74_10665 [Endozoicomonadaceae bacterium GTF-13]